MPKKKEKKLKIEDIKKNPDIEKKHFIHKFIEHEHEIMLGTTAIFMVLILVAIYIGTVAMENKDKIQIYYDGSLKIKYNIDISGVADIITLSDDNVVDKTSGEKREIKFSITNDSLTNVKYKVFLEEDDGMIELDNCKDKQVNKDAIRFSLNDKDEYSLEEKAEEGYLLKTGTIDASKTKNYKLKIWIDKESMKDVNKNHFHGRIVVINDE